MKDITISHLEALPTVEKILVCVTLWLLMKLWLLPIILIVLVPYVLWATPITTYWTKIYKLIKR